MTPSSSMHMIVVTSVSLNLSAVMMRIITRLIRASDNRRSDHVAFFINYAPLLKSAFILRRFF